MKATKIQVTKHPSALISRMAIAAAIIIALMPFHAFLCVWLASIFGHYTAIRLWKEVVLAGLFAGLIYLIATDRRVRSVVRRERLLWLIAGYVGLLLVGGLAALGLNAVSAKAFGYGLLLDARFLVFFVVCFVLTRHDDLLLRIWKRLILIPAAVAVGFAALQYSVLPADFLRHFGYGPDTIAPTATVDQKEAYRRIQSTLRGANPFGAYLVLVLSTLSVLLLRERRFRIKPAIMYVLSLAALFFTFSRSAWLGVLASTGLLLWLAVKSAQTRRLMVIAGLAALISFAAVGYGLRDNDQFQNVFFHTNEHSRSATSSNSGHFQAMADGMDDIGRSPLGSGTGTAGPASVYNSHGETRIAENYFVQIGQEIGVLGMVLFVAINVWVALGLWQRREHPLALVLFVSFVGITLINLLSHAWTDDTLAYIWWGFAGAVMALSGSSKSEAGETRETAV